MKSKIIQATEKYGDRKGEARTVNAGCATDYTRVFSRLLKAAGFERAIKHNHYRWSKGFSVSQVGCSRWVSVDWGVGSSLGNRPTDAEFAERRETELKMTAALEAKGYQADNKFGRCSFEFCDSSLSI